jgi:hypothetical protein
VPSRRQTGSDRDTPCEAKQARWYSRVPEVVLIAGGGPISEAAEHLWVDPRSVRRWRDRYLGATSATYRAPVDQPWRPH